MIDIVLEKPTQKIEGGCRDRLFAIEIIDLNGSVKLFVLKFDML